MVWYGMLNLLFITVSYYATVAVDVYGVSWLYFTTLDIFVFVVGDTFEKTVMMCIKLL